VAANPASHAALIYGTNVYGTAGRRRSGLPKEARSTALSNDLVSSHIFARSPVAVVKWFAGILFAAVLGAGLLGVIALGFCAPLLSVKGCSFFLWATINDRCSGPFFRRAKRVGRFMRFCASVHGRESIAMFRWRFMFSVVSTLTGSRHDFLGAPRFCS